MKHEAITKAEQIAEKWSSYSNLKAKQIVQHEEVILKAYQIVQAWSCYIKTKQSVQVWSGDIKGQKLRSSMKQLY